MWGASDDATSLPIPGIIATVRQKLHSTTVQIPRAPPHPISLVRSHAAACSIGLALAALDHAQELAERVTSEALQILVGAGYTTPHPIERYWRDARLTKIFECTSEIQQRIISDKLLGKPTRN